jgi:toxin-antitoxin system PIN domain toxin
VIIPDINLLIYAYDNSSPFHKKAGDWWKKCLTGSEPVGLPAVVLFGFVRVATNARAFETPMSVGEANECVRDWFKQPAVQTLLPHANHIEQTLSLLEKLGTAGNLVTDAQIAAIAIEHDAIVHTTDADFIRFEGLRWFNPITDAGSRTLRSRG